MASSDKNDNRLGKQKIIRIYLSGFLALALIYLGWRIVAQFEPLFRGIENPFVALFLAILLIVLVPPLLGSLIQFVLNPVLGKWQAWSDLVSLEERLVGELSKTRKNPVIVLINWPSSTERTMGIMTSIFPATDKKPEMGAVYVAVAPRAKHGYIRIIPTSEIEETSWTLKEFQVFQLTVGSVAPDALFSD